MNRFIFLILGCIITGNVYSKGFLPSIKRLKKKVRKALGFSKESFKDVLERVQRVEGEQIRETPAHIITLLALKKLSKSMDLQSPEQQYQVTLEKIQNLYWCKHKELVDKLKKSKGIAFKILKKEIKRKCDKKNSIFVQFALELEEEKKVLQESTTSLISMMTVRSNRKREDKLLNKKIQTTLDVVMKFKNNLYELIKVVDDILINV